jgi:hypothetical protein
MRRGYTCLWRKIWNNALLIEQGRRLTRFEAWLYITNVLAAGLDNPTAGLKRGEFVTSIRRLVECFHWSIGAVQRFIETLLQNSMIMRVEHQPIHPAIQEAGHFSVCNYETYNSPRTTELNAERYAERYTFKERYKESKNKDKRKYTHTTQSPAAQDVCVSPKILIEIYQQHNQSLPEVKALTSERLKKCRSRINQAVRDGCLEQYLSDFTAAVKKAQQTPFLRGEGVSGWRAGFDWFVGNHVNVYGVLEGKYDTAFAKASACRHVHTLCADSSAGWPAVASAKAGRTSRGDPIYTPRQ